MDRQFPCRVLLAITLCGIASRGWAASPAPVSLDSAQTAALRDQVEQFQALINRELQSSIDHPFGMLQDPKGVYLPDYGVVFHMEMNIVPMRMISMFDVRPYTEEELKQTRRAKLQRIGELKTHLSELLRMHGAELSALPSGQSVAVAVHLFNMPLERTEGLPSQIIVEVRREVLADPQTRNGSAEEFRKKVTYFDF